MTGVDVALMDELIASHLDIMRLEAGLRARVLDILTRLQRDLTSRLSFPDEMTAFTKARVQALLKEVTQVVDSYYQKAQGEADLTLRHVPEMVARHTAGILDASVTANLGSTLPTATFMERLAASSLIQGGPLAEWWSRLAVDVEFKIANAIRQGIVSGETNQQIIARIVGKRGSPGIMDIARASAAAVVQTATMTVANDARLETFKRNADVIPRLRWITALDGHVCPICAARADLEWTNDGHEPVGHNIPWANPPIHFNDRCIMSPVTLTFREMGIDIDEPVGTRASTDGPVPGTTTFAQWFSRRSAAQQDEQFGAARAKLYREGKLTVRQFVDMSGHPLTIKQLQAKARH